MTGGNCTKSPTTITFNPLNAVVYCWIIENIFEIKLKSAADTIKILSIISMLIFFRVLKYS